MFVHKYCIQAQFNGCSIFYQTQKETTTGEQSPEVVVRQQRSYRREYKRYPHVCPPGCDGRRGKKHIRRRPGSPGCDTPRQTGCAGGSMMGNDGASGRGSPVSLWMNEFMVFSSSIFTN